MTKDWYPILLVKVQSPTEKSGKHPETTWKSLGMQEWIQRVLWPYLSRDSVSPSFPFRFSTGHRNKILKT